MRAKALFLMVLMTCIIGIRCSNTAGPKEEEYEYRYNVEVTYTRPADYELNPTGQDDVVMKGFFYDPAEEWDFYAPDIAMTKTGELTYTCFISKIYIQKHGEKKHQVQVTDCYIKNQTPHAEYVSVQGAYDLETRIMQEGTALLFRMAPIDLAFIGVPQRRAERT